MLKSSVTTYVPHAQEISVALWVHATNTSCSLTLRLKDGI